MLRITLQRTSARRDVERAVADERARILDAVREAQGHGTENVLAAYQRLIEKLDEVLAP